MKDFTELKKGYYKGKLDGIRSERIRTGVFFDRSIYQELDYLTAMITNEYVEEEMGKLLSGRLLQLKKKINHYRKTILVDDQREGLRDFARRMNALSASGKRHGFKIYVEGDERHEYQNYLSAIKYLIGRVSLDYLVDETERHDLSIVFGNTACKLIFVYPADFEKQYPLFRNQVLDIASMAGLSDEACSYWEKYTLWQLSF